jgi:hypothetical protein
VSRNEAEVKDMTAADVDQIAEFVEEVTAPLHDRIKALEAEVQDLKARPSEAPAVRFRGPWRDGERYHAGEAVVRQGSLWIAARAPRPGEIPGAGAPEGEDDEESAWRLCAKRGKDGTVPAELDRRVRALEQNR